MVKLDWIRKNFFSTWVNSILTIAVALIVSKTIISLFYWAVINATFTGVSSDNCSAHGACWSFINARFNQFMYGFYPKDQQWRINLSYLVIVISVALLFIPIRIKNFRKYTAVFILLLYPIISFYLFAGGVSGLIEVPTSRWGGLHLTLVVSVTGIVASFPLGMALALARVSRLPIVKFLSTIFIEVWRGIPLISVLFMSSVLLPIFLPDSWEINKLLRALIGVTIFSSAYMAEVIRGGIQGLSKGQLEAAHSLGMSYWKTQIYIILPQAIKNVVPGIVNNFIALFKDTTLVLIIGLFDLLGMVQNAINNPKWISYSLEGYMFAGLVFWLFCFCMSRYSLRIEKKLSVS